MDGTPCSILTEGITIGIVRCTIPPTTPPPPPPPPPPPSAVSAGSIFGSVVLGEIRLIAATADAGLLI